MFLPTSSWPSSSSSWTSPDGSKTPLRTGTTCSPTSSPSCSSQFSSTSPSSSRARCQAVAGICAFLFLCACLCHCLCHVLVLVSVFSRPHRTGREVRLQCQSNYLRIRKFSSRGEDSCLHKYFSIFGKIVKTFTKKFSFRELIVNRTNSLVEICLSHVEIKVQIFYFWKHGRLHGRQIHPNR